MADFQAAFKKTMDFEGGYANDPADSGKETYKGVSRNNEKNWSGWANIDAIKKKVGNSPEAINKEAAKDAALQTAVLLVYKRDYWDSMNLDRLLDERVAQEIFDIGVNMGVGTASLFFQRVLNVINRTPTLALDGRVGPNTVAAFNSLKPSDKNIVWKFLNCLQGAKYIAICEANPTQEKFIRSWASRVFEQ